MKVKIDIISGFLGAGKTTLIKKICAEAYAGQNIVVIENEFGKVNIDGLVLSDNGIIVREMTAGCICCSLSGDFITAIMAVITEFNPEKIIIEPTGIAKLSDILTSCKNFRDNDVLEINTVITVVDVKRLQLSLSFSGEFFCDQIKATRTVILSKTVGVAEELIQEAIAQIREINNTVTIINLDWDEISAADILSLAKHEQVLPVEDKKLVKLAGRKTRRRPKAECISSCELETNELFTQEQITALFKKLQAKGKYGRILRGKGILKDPCGQWFKVDFVLGEVDFSPCGAADIGKMVIIGIDLNKKRILEEMV